MYQSSTWKYITLARNTTFSFKRKHNSAPVRISQINRCIRIQKKSENGHQLISRHKCKKTIDSDEEEEETEQLNCVQKRSTIISSSTTTTSTAPIATEISKKATHVSSFTNDLQSVLIYQPVTVFFLVRLCSAWRPSSS